MRRTPSACEWSGDDGAGAVLALRRSSLVSLPSDTLLTQVEVAERWRISTRSLERWRSSGVGPRFVKIGNAVRYLVGDVVRFEFAHLRKLNLVAGSNQDSSK